MNRFFLFSKNDIIACREILSLLLIFHSHLLLASSFFNKHKAHGGLREDVKLIIQDLGPPELGENVKQLTLLKYKTSE